MAIARGDSDRRRRRPGDLSRWGHWGLFAGHGGGASSPPSVWFARHGSRPEAGCSIRFIVRSLRLTLLSAVAMSIPFVRQAVAQQIPTNPPNGEVFDLTSNLNQSQIVSLANGATLTVNGNGHTLTLSNGAFFIFPQNPLPATLAFGNDPTQTITITGSSRNSSGGVISGSNVASGTSIPITGSATFLDNTATGNGGAIGFFNINGTLSLGSPGSTATFTGNTALNGGAIDDANAALALSGNAIFSGNTATSGNGGAIDNTGGQFVIIGDSSASNVTFTNNVASQNGGAVFAQNNSITVNGNVTLLNNHAMGGNGGAIDEASNSVSIGSAGSTVVITGNTASANGGAIFSQNNSIIVNGDDVTLSNNRAMGGNGGALDEESNSVSIGSVGSTVIITGNTATANGGAINSRNTGVTIDGADITLQGNTAGGNGGAVFENSGPVLMGDANGATVRIIGNIAGSVAGSNGGAIYDNNGSVTENGNVTLMNNMAPSGSGGAIYETNGSVLISISGGNVSVIGNAVGSNGGAIYEGSGGAVTIGNSAANVGITSNMAGSSGGGIYSQNGLVTITGVGITIEGNGATTGNGGAVYAGNGFTLNANGPATISSNAAGGFGGAVYLNSGNLNLNATGGDIGLSGNIAGGQGGAIYLNGGNLALNAAGGNISFSGNTKNSGAAPNAIYFNNAGSASQATFNTAAGQRISFFDPIESNSANGVVSVAKTGAGTVSFDGSQRQNVSNIYAQTRVQEGTFEVANSAVYGVNAPSTSFAVNSGAILQGGIAGTVAASQFTLQSGATLNIAGNAPAGSPFSVFTIDAAQASFQSSSRILFNTELNDASVQHTDLLVLSHAVADAPGTLVVTNFGGQGGDTGDRDGIRLVQAINGATTTPNNFTLPAGELRAGAFDYDLFRGGLNPSNFPNDWFLRSDFVSGGGGGGVGGGGGGGVGGGGGGGGGGGVVAAVAAVAVLAVVVAAVAVLAVVVVAVVLAAAVPCLCRSRHSLLIRRRTRCRLTSSFPSSGRNSPPMGSCSLWRGSWAFRSLARSTTGGAILTSRMIAALRLRPLPPRPRLLRSICRPGSRRCRPGRGRRWLPARSSRPQSGGVSSGKRSTTIIKPSPIPAPAAIWEASRAASIFCGDL